MDKELSHGQNHSHPNRMNDINKRVPQGRDTTRKLTELHPLHLYINDIVKYLPDTHTALYADDLVLWSTSANMYSAQANVNTSLRNLWTYCNLWKLKLNTNKTVYTIFSRRYKVERSVKIRYGGEEIQKDDAPQYLGLQLDPKLSMRKHIENTAAKAHQVGSEQANTTAAVHGLHQTYLEYSSAALMPPSHRMRGATAVLVRHKPQWHRHDRRSSAVVPSLIAVAPPKTVGTADLRGGTAETFNMFRRASAVLPPSHKRRGATAVLVRHKPQWHRHDRRRAAVIQSLIAVAPPKTIKTADLRGGTAETFNILKTSAVSTRVGPIRRGPP